MLENTMKILFQGDSITDAFRKPDEPNSAFQLGNGYVFLIAATLGERYPERGWEFVNRGVSGEGVSDLARRWQADALEHAPDVFSLLVGVNDTIRAMDGRSKINDDQFLETYISLVASVLARKPETRVLLLEPFLLEAGQITSQWKAHLASRQKVIARFAQERGFPLVPLQSIFDAACVRAPACYWAYDGIHPTHAGFRLMADAWLAAAAPILQVPNLNHSKI